MRRNLYIAVEGIDGAGKTTQARRLAKILRKNGLRTKLIHEPTDGEVGKLIRRFLRRRDKVSEEALALLFAADRLILRDRVINTAIKKGYYIVSDRSVVSSLAYQSVATAKKSWVDEINRFSAKPDVVVFIDVDVEDALKRLGKSSQRYEKDVFLRKVNKRYKEILNRFRRVVVVDGDQPVEAVTRDIVAQLSKFIPALKQ